jgi:hypothetical protein
MGPDFMPEGRFYCDLNVPVVFVIIALEVSSIKDNYLKGKIIYNYLPSQIFGIEI